MGKVADRVKETTTTSGSGTITTTNVAPTGYRTLAAAVTAGDIADGDLLEFVVTDGSSWEIYEGTFNNTAHTLTKTTLRRSSTGSAISWPDTSPKDVWLDLSAFLYYWQDRANLRKIGEVVNSVSATTASTTIDLNNGNIVALALSSSTTLSFGNPYSSGTHHGITIYAKQDATGGRIITWPGAVTWDNGVAPTQVTTANKTGTYSFTTRDGGATWLGYVGGLAH